MPDARSPIFNNRAWGALRLSKFSAIWLVLALAVFIIAILPLIYTIDASFYKENKTGLTSLRSIAPFVDVFTSQDYLEYLWKAIYLASIVTFLSVSLGVALALILARTNLPYRGVFDLLVIIPMFLSPFTGLISWIALGSVKTGFINVFVVSFGNYLGFNIEPIINIWSFSGIVWILFLFFTSLMYLFISSSLRSMDSSLEESARTTGATAIQSLLKITLPMQIPAIVSSALLIFIFSAEMYTIPGLIGATFDFITLPWKIYQDSTAFPVHQAHAAAAATMLLIIAFIGMMIQRYVTRKSTNYITVSGKGFKSNPIDLGKWTILSWVLVLGYIFCAVVLPVAGMVMSSLMKYSAPFISSEIFTFSHYVQIFTLQNILHALWNTAWLAVMTGLICVLIGFSISYMEVRKSNNFTKTLGFIATLPVAVPSLVYGLGLLWVYIQTPLYGTTWVLLLAYTAKFLPYSIMTSRSGVLQLHPEMEESARMVGATAEQSIRYITMPIMKTTLIAILVFVMLQSIKELSSSVLLYTQNSQVLSVLTWHYMDSGNYQFAAAIGAVQTMMMLGLVILTRLIFRVKFEKIIGN